MAASGGPRIYACQSRKVSDLAENDHVLCAGIDLTPALDTQMQDGHGLAEQLREACVAGGGSAAIPQSISRELLRVAKILNIGWVESGLQSEARVICSRGAVCPRDPQCYS